MKFAILFLVSLVAATPVAQLGGGGKSFLCQHDHLHMNPDCKSGGTGAGSSGGGLAGLLSGGAGAGSSGGLADLLKGAGGAAGAAAPAAPAAAAASDAKATGGEAKAASPKAAGGHSHGAR